jgi:hypothetical protein
MKAACIQTIRKALSMIKESFSQLVKQDGHNEQDEGLTQNAAIIGAYVCAPNNSVLILREQVLYQAVK